MKVKVLKVNVDLDTRKILEERGLGESRRAVKFLASVVKDYCDEYVPFAQGTLKDAQITDEGADGASIVYNTDYAHYQYYGEVMAGRAPKHYTGVPLTYGGGGRRGKEWDKRMMADRGADVTKALAEYVGGKVK